MASTDRTGAEIFGNIIAEIASTYGDVFEDTPYALEIEELANNIYDMGKQYSFTDNQAYDRDDFRKLNLGQRCEVCDEWLFPSEIESHPSWCQN